MRKHFILTILSAILFFASASLIGSTVSASTDGDMLITVGGKTVTANMTISEIENLFGEPKLETDSYWGGKACTFYGADYSDYLYIETNANGKILGYGSVSKDFKTSKFSYGEKPDHFVRIGEEATGSDSKLFGVIYYTERHYDAYELFNADFTKNNRNLCLHAVEMWNAVSFLHGYNTPTTFNERIFNINSQLAENGSCIYDYAGETGQSSMFQLMMKTGDITYQEYRYPNPLFFGQKGKNFKCKGGVAGFTMIKGENGKNGMLLGFCSTSILNEWNPVELTDREQQLAQTASEYMNASIETFNSAEAYYEIEPSYESVGTITGGKLDRNIAEGAVGLINAIRVGGGLPALTYSENLSEAAQCKSTYTVYLSKNSITNTDPHNPPKIDGISDEFYNKCQAGSSENLFMCGITSTNIIGSITNALDDSAGTGQNYSRGHRYNLLNPGIKTIGLGNTEQQGCHKMSGSQSYNVDVVAWPANGITVIGSGFSPSGMWTCKFYNGMKPTSTTTIDIRCLNNGDTWQIKPSKLTDKQAFRASGSLLSYQDTTISFRKGGVYQISFSNLTDSNGNSATYSYRTAYLDVADDGESGTAVNGVTLDKKMIYLEAGTSGKLNALIQPTTAANKRIYFTSSADDIVTVNDCGELTAVKKGKAVITASSEDGNHEATCTVKVVAKGECIHNLTKVEAKEATCVKPGNIEYWTCSKCHMIFSDEEGDSEMAESDTIIAQLEHEYNYEVADEQYLKSAATCVSPAVYVKSCVCGKAGTETFECGNVDMDAHDWNNDWQVVEGEEITCIKEGQEFDTCKWDTSHKRYRSRLLANHTLTHSPAVDETCTEDGMIEYWHCSVCERYFTNTDATVEVGEKDIVVPAAHKLIQHAAKAATYKAEGQAEYYECDRCGGYFSDGKGVNNIEAGSWVLKKLTPKAQKVTVKAAKKTVKYKKLKKKAITVAPLKVKGNKGKVTYKLVSGNAKAKKALKLNKKTGKVTVKKKTRKGTYTIKVKVSAAATASGEYKAFNKTVKVTVKVK